MLNFFRSIILFYFCLLSSSISLCVEDAESTGEKVGINAIKQLAVANNSRVKAFQERVEASKARSHRSSANFYPSFAVKGGVEQEFPEEKKGLSNLAYVVATWNLFNGGKDIGSKDLSNKQMAISELELAQEKLKVEKQAEDYFYHLLFARDTMKIKESFLELNKTNSGYAKRAFSSGSISEADVMEFELLEARLRSEQAEIEQLYSTNLVKLRFLLGEKVAVNPTPVGQLQHVHLKGQPSDYLNEALKEAPLLKLSTLGYEVSAAKTRMAKSRWFPKVDLEGKYGLLPQSEGFDRNENEKPAGSVALIATWELFSGFDSVNEIREARASLAESDQDFKANIQDLLAELEANFGELMTIEKQADVEKNNIKFAKRYYEIVLAEYKRGYKNSGDLKSAIETWHQTEVRRKQLDLNFLKKRIEIEKQLGKEIKVEVATDVSE